MSIRVVAISMIALLIGLRAVWFVSTHERIEYEERGPASAKVQNFRHYGFSQYLNSLGIKSRQLHSLNTATNLPDTDTTLFFTSKSSFITEAEYKDIATWVASGGQIVLPNDSPDSTSFLSYFGFHPAVLGDNEGMDTEDANSAAAPDEALPVVTSDVDNGKTQGVPKDTYSTLNDELAEAVPTKIDENNLSEDSTDSSDVDSKDDVQQASVESQQQMSGDNDNEPKSASPANYDEFVDEHLAKQELLECSAPKYFLVKTDGKLTGIVARDDAYWYDLKTVRPILSKVTYSLDPDLHYAQASDQSYELQDVPLSAPALHDATSVRESLLEDEASANKPALDKDSPLNASSQSTEKLLGHPDLPANVQTLYENHSDIESDAPYRERLFSVTFAYGLGVVTVVGDDRQVSNYRFHQNDNAYTLYKALSATRELSEILFVSVFDRTSLWDLIWQRGAHLILWLALGIICFFWWASQRFGRVFANPSDDRREFHEHISASGKFLWHNRQRVDLIEKSQQRVLQKLTQRYPHLKHATDEQKRRYVSQLFNGDAAVWDIATAHHLDTTKHQFFEQTKALQLLWKKI